MTISPNRRILLQGVIAAVLAAAIAACSGSDSNGGGGGGGGGGGTGPSVNPAVSGVAVNPSTVIGGNAAQGTVTLSAAPTAGTPVALSSNNGAATVPGAVTVASGTNSATFNIATTAVTAPIGVTILASLNGASQSAQLTLNPPTEVPFASVVRVVSLSAARRKQGNDTVEIAGRPAGSLNTCPLVNDGNGQRLDCEIDASASTSPGGISRYRYKWRLSTVDGDSGNITAARHRPAVQDCGYFGGQNSSNQQLNMRVVVEVTNNGGQVATGTVEGVSVFPAGLCGYAF